MRPFKKEYKHFLLMPQPDDESAKLKELTQLTDTTTRLNVELAGFSNVRSFGGSVCWVPEKASGGRSRVLSVFASDVYIMPGKQFFPVHFPSGERGDATYFHKHANLAQYLTAEVDDVNFKDDDDSRRTGCVLKAIALLTGYAHKPDKGVLKSSKIGPPLRALLKVKQPEIAKAAEELLRSYAQCFVIWKSAE